MCLGVFTFLWNELRHLHSPEDFAQLVGGDGIVHAKERSKQLRAGDDKVHVQRVVLGEDDWAGEPLRARPEGHAVAVCVIL